MNRVFLSDHPNATRRSTSRRRKIGKDLAHPGSTLYNCAIRHPISCAGAPTNAGCPTSAFLWQMWVSTLFRHARPIIVALFPIWPVAQIRLPLANLGLHEFSEKLCYMHRRLVRRGLVSEPGEWRWSSFRHYAIAIAKECE